jgi:hypothetical protein
MRSLISCELIMTAPLAHLAIPNMGAARTESNNFKHGCLSCNMAGLVMWLMMWRTLWCRECGSTSLHA